MVHYTYIRIYVYTYVHMYGQQMNRIFHIAFYSISSINTPISTVLNKQSMPPTTTNAKHMPNCNKQLIEIRQQQKAKRRKGNLNSFCNESTKARFYICVRVCIVQFKFNEKPQI